MCVCVLVNRKREKIVGGHLRVEGLYYEGISVLLDLCMFVCVVCVFVCFVS